MTKTILILTLIFFAGCGYVEKSKDIGKDIGEELNVGSPLGNSNQKEALANAREQVERSKSKHNSCLKRNSGDESACQATRAQYDEDVDRYIELQKQ